MAIESRDPSSDRAGGRPPARIFLSSTAEDLEEHRAQVAQTIERLQQQPIRMGAVLGLEGAAGRGPGRG